MTFVFSDVEGSTKLLERHPEAYGAAIARHHELLEQAVERRGGVVFETIGDAVYAAFADPVAAVEAAADGQLALLDEDWGELAAIHVRMGIHTGRVERRGAHYFGTPLYRCARVTATAHGGQVVLSEATARLVENALDGRASLLDLGSHRLKDMLEPERVYQLVRDPLPSRFPELRSAGGRPNNLPAEVKSFVGRREELETLRGLLAGGGTRLVTLTGPGGSGKTRLAIRAAADLLEPFKDGVFLVDLTPLASASLVIPAIAQVLNVQETAGRSLADSVATHLAGREMLLVLDNFEHVVDAAPEVAGVLAAAARVRVLATSRVPLHVQGESEVDVGPLPVPAPGASLEDVVAAPAVQLFAERAREIRAEFAVTAANAPAVAEICRGLDGLPLAIELAAARTRLLSPEKMLPRIERRLGLLTGGSADLPSRQRTLRDAIGWSYDLLAEREQTLFRRLAVFRGGCTLDAAEALCGDGDVDVLDALTVLSEHSLLRTRWNELGEPRFQMLETIAEFARERLDESGDAPELARRHAEFFAALAEEAAPHLQTDAARQQWLRRLSDDRDNIRTALAWSVANDEASPALRILGSVWLWWWLSFGEGVAWAERVLALPSAAEPTRDRARALFTAEICAAGAGDLAAIVRYADEAVATSTAVGDDPTLALALGLLGGGDPENPQAYEEVAERAIAIAARTRDPWLVAWVKMISALDAMLVGNLESARTWGAAAVDEFRRLGDSWSRASASLPLGVALLQLGDLDGARRALDGSVAALLAVGDLKMANACSLALAAVARFSGDDDESAGMYRQALDLCIDIGDPANSPLSLEGLAAATAGRDPRRAARLLGAARALFDAGFVPIVPGFEPFYDGTYERLEHELGDVFAAELQDGRRAAADLPLAEVARV